MAADMKDVFEDKDELDQFLDEYRRQVAPDPIKAVISFDLQYVFQHQGKWLNFDSFIVSLCVMWMIYMMYMLITTYCYKYQRYRFLVDRASSANKVENIELCMLKTTPISCLK